MLLKGMKMEQFIGAQPSIMFDMNEDGAVLFYIVNESDLKQFKLGGHYDFWCTSFNETLFFAVKLGDNHWASAPYTPFLSAGYTPAKYPEGEGMSLTVVLISNADGTIKDIDFMVLGNSFSNQVNVFVQDILNKGFNGERYQLTIDAVYQKFATDDELTKEPGATYSID